MNKKKQQLTDHIREVLKNHEEPYVLGSWERFQRHNNRYNKNRRRKIIISIAASILLILSFLYTWNPAEQILPDQFVEEHSNEEPGIFDPETLLSPLAGNDSSVTEDKTDEESIPTREITPIIEAPEQSFAVGFTFVDRKTVPQPTISKIAPGSMSRIAEESGRDSVITGQPGFFLTGRSHYETSPPGNIVQEADIRRVSSRARDKQVLFSVAYAPLVNIHNSETDWGAGGGFFTDWNFSNNVSLSSGLFIAQNQLKYKNDQAHLMRTMEDDQTGLLSANLAYMQVDLISLEVPLSLRYSITDQLSFSAGVSSIAFLKENYDYTFEYQQQIQVFENNENTTLEPVTRMVTLTETQNQSEPSLNGMDWAAFYTFSIGYQQEIANRHTVSFEPFLKIPTGRMASREIKYTTGGLQLKIFF